MSDYYDFEITREALHKSIESLTAYDKASTDTIVTRAKEFEKFLRQQA